MSEASKQSYILSKLRSIENSEWEKATVTNRNGSQDIKGHIEGYYIAIEVKVNEKTKPSELQNYRIRRTLEKGGISFWSYSWEHCLHTLFEFSKIKRFNIIFKPTGIGHNV